MKTAFIGSGNMARAIIGGMIGSGTAGEDILVINPGNPKSCAEVKAIYGSTTARAEDLGGADVIVLAVKPQSFSEAAPKYKDFIGSDTLVISIMAGVPSESVSELLGVSRVIRVMPNLALSVGCGASGIAPGAGATETDMQIAEKVFSASGIAVRIREDQINDIAAISGSGAAYIYYMVESLREAAIVEGIDPGTAAALARQTLIGAARLLEADSAPPEELRRRITSKKGTTEAAVMALTEAGLPEAVLLAYRANKRRSEELARGQ